MKVPSLLSDTFLLLTGARPIRSGERGRGTQSSQGRPGAALNSLQRAERTEARPGAPTARRRVKGPGAQKGGQRSARAHGRPRRGPEGLGPGGGSLGLSCRGALGLRLGGGRGGNCPGGTRACGTRCAPRFSDELADTQGSHQTEAPTFSPL